MSLMKGKKYGLNLDGTDDCASSNLRRVSRSITTFYEAALRPAHLRPTGFTILVAIAKREPVAVGSLASELLLDPTTVTRSLQLLQRMGLIAISARSINRQRFVTLLPKGRRTLNRSVPLWRQAQGRLVGKVGLGFWKELQGELEKLAFTAIELTEPGTGPKGRSVPRVKDASLKKS
jgi:DNA-binding MarR family transcriptional regulator